MIMWCTCAPSCIARNAVYNLVIVVLAVYQVSLSENLVQAVMYKPELFVVVYTLVIVMTTKQRRQGEFDYNSVAIYTNCRHALMHIVLLPEAICCCLQTCNVYVQCFGWHTPMTKFHSHRYYQ